MNNAGPTSKSETFAQYLATQSPDIYLLDFFIDMGLAIALSYLLAYTYIRYGRTLSNRKSLAYNFILLAATTTLVIAVVKSSLALSLGLVGALSIVRFRAAIKEPEELAYLFLNIAIGLGLGASQRQVTVCAVLIIIAFIWFRGQRKSAREVSSGVYLTISAGRIESEDFEAVLDAVVGHVSTAKLKSYHETADSTEAIMAITIDTWHDLSKVKADIQSIIPTASITLYDASRVE